MNSLKPAVWKRAFVEAGAVALVAVTIAAAYNLLASTGVPWIAHPPELQQTTDAEIQHLLDGRSDAATDSDAFAAAEPIDTAAALEDTAQKRLPTAAAVDTTPSAAPRVRAATDSSETTAKQPTPHPPPAAAAPREINTDQAKRIFDKGGALWVDARNEDEFAQGHIPGAINVYAYDFGPHIPTLLGYDFDRLVVVYCGGGLCELSHEAADEMVKLGFRNVLVYTGGTEEWNAKNYPFTR